MIGSVFSFMPSSFLICFSRRLNTSPIMTNNDAHNFHEGSASPRKTAALKNPTTGTNKVKGTTTAVEYVFNKNPQMP